MATIIKERGQTVEVSITDTITVTVNGHEMVFPLVGSTDEPVVTVEPTTAHSPNLVKIVRHESRRDDTNVKFDEEHVHDFELFTKESLKSIDRQKIESLIRSTFSQRKNGRQQSSSTKEQFTQAACVLAANIMEAACFQKMLRYGKHIAFKHQQYYKLNRRHYDRLVDLFEKAGLITLVKEGYSTPSFNQPSVWGVSLDILNYTHDIHEDLLKGHNPLVTEDFTDGKGSMTPEEEAEHAPYSRERLNAIARDFLKRINLPTVPPYRSFNDNGNLGGRVYCGFIQRMPKQARQDLLWIDDQPTVEVDFSASHLQLLSKLVTGKWISETDPYTFTLPNGKKADRDKCKAFFTRAPNATNVYGAMKKAGWTSDEYKLYKEGFKAAYPEIAEWFGTKAGCYLQKIEGDILETLMYEYFTEHNEILIPIHDAVICRQGIEYRVAQDMLRIRDEVVARYSLEDMRDKLQLHDDIRRAILFEKNELQKEKEKEAEETPFVEDNEDFVQPEEEVKTVKKFVITEELVQKAIEKVKRRADEVVGYINEESAFLDSDACPAEERNTKYLIALGRRIKSRGVEEETVMRLMRGLNDGVNIIGELYKEDVDLVRKHKRPKWFN